MKPYLLLCFLLFTRFLNAQDPISLKDKPGTWSYQYINDENTKWWAGKYKMKAEELPVFKEKLDKVVNVFHQHPILAQPKGFDPKVESRLFFPYNYEKYRQTYGYVGEINFYFQTWFKSKEKEYRMTIEPPRFTVYINNCQMLNTSGVNYSTSNYDQNSPDDFNQISIITQPNKVKELAPGVTLYEKYIIVAKPGREYFKPLIVEDFFKKAFEYYEQAVKKDPGEKFVYDYIKSDYAKLTKEQQKSPAYAVNEGVLGVGPVKNGYPLYVFDNNYFDKSLPRTAIQIMVVPLSDYWDRPESDFAPSNVGFLRIHQLTKSFDYTKLVDLLDLK